MSVYFGWFFTISLKIFMRFLFILSLYLCLLFVALPSTSAAPLGIQKKVSPILVPHKALYSIELVETRSGSQVSNIAGKMFYEWKSTCDAWVTDHRFSIVYEYADSPAMRITSDFSTHEGFDGAKFNFSARRGRDADIYQELRGIASLGIDGGKARFNLPKDLALDLPKGAMFPMKHTLELAKRVGGEGGFFSAIVFDGSDDDGPIEINSFIGQPVNAMDRVIGNNKIDMKLINTPTWNVRMAVFPVLSDVEIADYEMSMVFHENGIISDMLIEYDDFSVTQKLVALEEVKVDYCSGDILSQKNRKN
jgi:hypothetical protein